MPFQGPRVFPEIDLVYTWVDGDDPEHRAQREFYAHRPIDLNPERFRDDHQLLRYSLRSVERYMGWVRRIYLLTQRPQVPAWLRTDHPKLKLVHHDQVFENPDWLPCFNSEAIETHLHRIPGLAEHFLYFNDDWLLLRNIRPSDFIDPQGRILVRGTKVHLRGLRWLLGMLIISKGAVAHVPLLYRRDLWMQALDTLGPVLEETRRSRFRAHTQPTCFLFDTYRRFLYQQPQSMRVMVDPFRTIFWHYQLGIRPNLFWQYWVQTRAFVLQRPAVLCVNDDQGLRPNPKVRGLLKYHLERSLPGKSSFEK